MDEPKPLSDKKRARIEASLSHAKYWQRHRHFKIFCPWRRRKVVQITFVDKRLANHYAVDVDQLLREIDRLKNL